MSAGTTTARSSTGLRAHRAPVLVGLVALAGAVLFAVVAGGSGGAAPLDPDDPGRSGARALHRVLEDHGVEVTVVRSAADLEATPVDPATTVLVTSTGDLGTTTARRLLAHAAGAEVVVAEPRAGVDRALGLPEGVPTVLGGPVPADCGEPLVDGLEVDVLTATAYPTPQGCFGSAAGYLLARGDRGVVALGAAGILTNGAITEADNAAVALRLLGGNDRLVWYVPDPADVPAGDAVAIGELVPRWVSPSLWLLGVATIALMVWRGRRLGPVVTEPLPVVVTAIESTRSRGRLYRKAGDRAHAARVLRVAACARLAGRLALPTGSDAGTIAHLLGPSLSRPTEQLRALLDPLGPPPTTDADLIELGNRLEELDREVRP